MKRMRCLFVLVCLGIFSFNPALLAQTKKSFGNELGLNWPWELTHTDFPAGTYFGSDVSVSVHGQEARPGQVEQVMVDGKKVDRVWYIVTLQGELYEDKKRKQMRRKKPPTEFEVEFTKSKSSSDLKLVNQGKTYLIDNGTYEFRLMKYNGSLKAPTELGKVPHWMRGVRVKGNDTWDGRAWFEGKSKVVSATTEILQQGPVFIDFKITYEFADTTTGEEIDALPMMLGKHSHTFTKNIIPREKVAKQNQRYEVKLRFVYKDNWIEVVERYHMPRGKEHSAFGTQLYWMQWGEPIDVPADKVDIPADQHWTINHAMWTRWFEYDTFGGNTEQRTLPAKPRAAQKGRPFAQMRPRWNQGPAGSQDVVLTGEGRPKARWRGKDGKWVDRPADPTYSPEQPSAGIVAAYPSKWVGPYAATIMAYAFGENRGKFRFNLTDGEPGRFNGLHYGARCYAIIVDQRKNLQGTGNINSIVRRHTDWTLVAQMNKYILKWDRDPSVAGANIVISREKIKQIQADLKAGKNTPEVLAVKETLEKLAPIREEGKKLNAIAGKPRQLDSKIKDLNNKVRREKDKAKQAELKKQIDVLKKERKAVDAPAKEAQKQLKKINKKLGSEDAKILALIQGEKIPGRISMPNPHLYIGRRYQDDSVNPTNFGNRRLVNGPFLMADLFSIGKPFGGPWQAATGYIYSDLDAWPGWHQGWSPGNPNFHTDKYIAALFAAAAMSDHPHAKEWMEFGKANFAGDTKKVILEPDGVGYECPGYAGFAMYLQLKTAKIYTNAKIGNPVAENPMFKKSGIWHRKLLTPYDKRLGFRHTAPIGDTHRWTSGMANSFGTIASFYAESDPDFAREMVGAYMMLKKDGGLKGKKTLLDQLTGVPTNITPMDPMEMDWSSQHFWGFGPIMRSGFGTPQETFLSMKAGVTKGHYHNDENSYHYYADGTPISLDYNCSYSPRGDHAAIHNSMTFGKLGKVMNNNRGEMVEAQEQIGGTAVVAAFASKPEADAVIAERNANGVSMAPIRPRDAEFQRGYPYRKPGKITHRRMLAMIKHPPSSKMTDYLVIREETISPIEQQVNIHLLARDIEINGDTVFATGQYDKDMIVKLVSAEEPEIQRRSWWYRDEWLKSPGDHLTLKVGESQKDYVARMEKMMKDKGLKSLPAEGWKPQHGNWKMATDEHKAWIQLISDTDGQALIPPPNWTGVWKYGEYQIWLRVQTKPGTPVFWVLYPYERGTEQPKIEKLANGKGVRVTLGDETEEIYMATDPAEGIPGQVVVKRNGKTSVILGPDAAPELGTVRLEKKVKNTHDGL